ncbi:hypothetical protein ES703_83776 [subsurface metagenome]
MKDPIDLPARYVRQFVCINIVTGHIRKRKTMTAEMARRINSYDHMQGTGYKWLWNDQYDFNDKLVDDARLVNLD